MAGIFQLKRSSVSGRVPDAANVEVGEPVVNLADQIIYTKDGSGTVKVIGAGTTSNIAEGTNLYFTNARVVAALTEGSGINIDANGLISADIVGGGSSNAFATIHVDGQSNVVATHSLDTVTLQADGLVGIYTDPVNKKVTFTTNKTFPFYDHTSSYNAVPLRVVEGLLTETLDNVYLPFTNSNGDQVTTLRMQ